jgi:hypothetical protein
LLRRENNLLYSYKIRLVLWPLFMN